eukprot:2116844-Prymnesium_polylepis.1
MRDCRERRPSALDTGAADWNDWNDDDDDDDWESAATIARTPTHVGAQRPASFHHNVAATATAVQETVATTPQLKENVRPPPTHAMLRRCTRRRVLVVLLIVLALALNFGGGRSSNGGGNSVTTGAAKAASAGADPSVPAARGGPPVAGAPHPATMSLASEPPASAPPLSRPPSESVESGSHPPSPVAAEGTDGDRNKFCSSWALSGECLKVCARVPPRLPTRGWHGHAGTSPFA